MRKIIPLLFFLFTGILTAQVGINTTAPNAQLDIRSANQAAPTNQDGLLIPKIDVFPAANPTAAQHGMLVFLTTTAGANLPGFYYWDNPTASWKGIGNDNPKWDLAGNTGTNPATQFIGTTDNQDVVFKRQNIRAGFLGTGVTSFGFNSLISNAGGANTAFGASSLRINGLGAGNTAVGFSALMGNTGGDENTAIGFNALQANTIGDQNVAVGTNALQSATNSGINTAVGYNALGNVSGIASNGNVALGRQAGNNLLSGSGNIFIGNNANAVSTTVNNQLNIGNTIFGIMGTNKAVGLNTPLPQAALDVNSNNMGVLIPRIALTSAIVQAPVIHPIVGAIPESTLIYNTATAGTAPNNVTPGFYYWNGAKWIRFDVNGENLPKYYIAEGTTSVFVTGTMAQMPDMTVTFTPKNSTAIVNFSAAGFFLGGTACGQDGLFFQLLLNGVPIKGWQNSVENISNVTDRMPWDSTFSGPVAVTPGIPQTISVNWVFPGCNSANAVANPSGATAGLNYQAHRSLMVVDPNGGGGVVGSPPVISSNWALTGNSGTNSVANFIGTVDNVDLVFKRNSLTSGRIGLNNTSFGNSALAATTGIDNTGFGVNALVSNLGGAGNTAVGNQALRLITTGSNNTAIGRNAQGQFFDLVNATAIGANSFVSNDNCLVLGSIAGVNTAAASTNVGIGTSDPLRTLHVTNNGSSITQGQLYLQQAGSGDVLMHYGISNGRHYNMGIDATDNAFKIGTSATTADASSTGTLVTVMPTGAVGIGTAAPEAMLHIFAGESGVAPNTNTKLALEDDDDVYQHFLTPVTEESGILFGTTAGALRGGIIFNNATTISGFQFRAGGNLTRMTLTGSGDLGIGTTAPGGQLQLSLDEGRKPGTVAWTVTSDERLKTIHGAYAKGLDEIDQLRPILYHYKNVGEKTFEKEVLDKEYAGFSAQEVQKIFPEAVGVDDDGYLNFNMHPILVASVNAIRELKQQNEKLAEENRKLQQKLESHDRQLQQILNRLSPEGR